MNEGIRLYTQMEVVHEYTRQFMTIRHGNLDSTDFLEKYMLLYNLSMPQESRLVKSEMELVTEFTLLPPKFEHSRFSSLAKDKVIESLAEKDKSATKASINSKIYDLLRKSFLYRDEDKVIYLPKHLVKAHKEFSANGEFTINIHLNGSK